MSKDDWTEVVMSEGNTWDRKAPIEGVLKKSESGIGPNESMLYTIKTKDGDIGVWGSTVLDTKLEEVEIGSMIRIEPLGKVKSEKTGREYMDFKVMWKPFGGFEVSGADDTMPADFLED